MILVIDTEILSDNRLVDGLLAKLLRVWFLLAEGFLGIMTLKAVVA